MRRDDKAGQASRKYDFSFHALSVLRRMEIEPIPVNFELMYEIVSGANPELGKQFAALGKQVSKADIEALARKYLPHHFEESLFDKSSTAIQSELNGLQGVLVSSQLSMKDFSNSLGTASDRFSRIDPRDTQTLRNEIEQIKHATDRQQQQSAIVSQTVARQMEAINSVTKEMDDAKYAKFTHLASGLGNRRAFYKRMAELYRGDRFPDGISLVFGQIANFEVLERLEFLKHREQLIARLGERLVKCLADDEQGFWLDGPHIALVLNMSTEAAIREFNAGVGRLVNAQLEPLKSRLPRDKPVVMRFGVSNTYCAKNSADLIKNSEDAMRDSLSLGWPHTAFYEASEATPEGKSYALYGRQQLTL